MSDASDREIADLDATLAADGEWIELSRLFGSQQIPVKVTCRAFVRATAAKDLIGSITLTQSDVIMSPTEIIRAGWPGPWTQSANERVKPLTDRRVPVKGDKVTPAHGRLLNVELVKPTYVDNELVRLDLKVSG
jgi:hypothetical protein